VRGVLELVYSNLGRREALDGTALQFFAGSNSQTSLCPDVARAQRVLCGVGYLCPRRFVACELVRTGLVGQVLVEDVHLLALSDLLCSHCFRSGVAVASRVFVTLEESV